MTDRRRLNDRSSNRLLRTAIEGVLKRRNRTIVDECRHCGTSVSSPEHTCPTCGSDEIVRYTI
ncbi:zinc ribbon domain-containing protein [Halosolutus gelatinilyticus]|uniref:zinc ribbon domain-containing protein n=1 Tax=Halosolutus gelatinilyticus TaxID=2931975 RepID=UPI001FF679C7|nr:zinc ribbon domain-containing protein [Halosolutus gelatinilyticus]